MSYRIKVAAMAVGFAFTSAAFAADSESSGIIASQQGYQQAGPLGGQQAQVGSPMNFMPLPTSLPASQQAVPGPDVDKVMSDMFGLTPDQIRELRKQNVNRLKATAEYPGGMPKAVTTRVRASMAPGSTPPVVRLFPGFATSIIVTDASGAPWPIENFAVGHRDLFEVKRLDKASPDGWALSIVPLGYYAQSNIILYLKGAPTPISISLISGQKEVDYRAEVTAEGMGPNAQVAAAGLPSSTNTQLLSLLEGVAPSDAKQLKTSMPDAQAWLASNGKMFFRTKLSIISPAWIGSVRSADGMTAYEMQASSSILVMKEGKISTLVVEGW